MKQQSSILQFRIELRDIKPSIWRRIQVPSWYSLWDLHVAIQDAMGWQDRHLHAFRPDGEEWIGKEFGIPPDDDMDDMGVEILADYEYPADLIFREAGDHSEYLYDFGDSWSHDVELELILPSEEGVVYPRCTDGARACPPEDCGSVPGYERLLEAMAHPDDEESQELLGWLGGDLMRYPPFEPDVFDLSRVVFDDPNRRWKGTFLGDKDYPVALPPREPDGRPKKVEPLTPEQEKIEDILDRIEFFTGRYEREAVDAAIALRDAIIPELLDILVDAFEHPVSVAEAVEYSAHLYAIMLLGHLRAVEAHEIIIALTSLPGELTHDVFGMIVTEDLPLILLRTCGGDFTSIKLLAGNRDADEYCRGAATEAIAFAVMEGSISRKDALDWLGSQLQGADAEDSKTFHAILASNICDLYPGEMMPLINAAYDRDIIAVDYIDLGFFEETIASGEQPCLDRFRREYDQRSLDDLHARMEWWSCFKEDTAFDAPPSGSIPGLHPASSAKNKKSKSKRRQAKASRKKNRRK